MATNEVPRGPISGYVVENVRRLRGERKWSLVELSDRMGAAGRPMLASGLHRLEQGSRRIDVDDLVALAIVFDCAPVTLLFPPDTGGDVQLTWSQTVEALVAWDWARGVRPFDLPADEQEAAIRTAEFQLTAVPSPLQSADLGKITRAMLSQRLYADRLQQINGQQAEQIEQQAKQIELLNQQLQERAKWLREQQPSAGSE